MGGTSYTVTNPTDSQEEITALLAGLQIDNPRLYTMLSLMAGDLGLLFKTVYPLQAILTTLITTELPPLAPVGLIVTQRPTSVRVQWSAGDTASRTYEVREGGADWEHATFLTRTPSTQVELPPTTSGFHTYRVKSIGAGGTYSVGHLSGTFFVTGPGQALPTATVIDNNVLLRWVAPATVFNISHYIVYREGVQIGTLASTFFVWFEPIGGTFTYGVSAVDVGGNIGAPGYVTATVNQPPDYVLYSTVNSAFGGSKTNVKLAKLADGVNGDLVCCVDTTKTYELHFNDNGWTTPQNQIDAGYPIYIEPAKLTGSYQEVYDYAAVLNNVIVNLSWGITQVVGSVIVTSTIESSLDGSSWSTPVAGPSALFASFRYLRITIIFTPANDKSLILFYNLKFVLNVREELDSGLKSCLASDNSAATNSTHIGGTNVPFTKAFRVVNSITLTPVSSQPLTAIYDFIGVVNPESFKIFVFDSSGNRVDATVSWKVRGIV